MPWIINRAYSEEPVGITGELAVKLGNVTGLPIKIYAETNSWAASRWRVLRIRRGHLETYYQTLDRDFLVNGPATSEIASGGRTYRELDVNGPYWCAFGRCAAYNERRSGDDSIRFEAGDTVVIIYDPPYQPPESWTLKVWHGVVVASTTIR